MSRHLDPSEPLELSLKPDLGYPPPDPLFKATVLRKATFTFVSLAHDWSKCVKFAGVICIYMLGTNEKLHKTKTKREMPEQKVGNWHVLVLVKLRRTCTKEREL